MNNHLETPSKLSCGLLSAFAPSDQTNNFAYLFSPYYALEQMYIDMQLFYNQPMTEWLHNANFWRFAIQLAVFAAIVAVTAANPFGLGVLGLICFAYLTFFALGYFSQISGNNFESHTTPDKNSKPEINTPCIFWYFSPVLP